MFVTARKWLRYPIFLVVAYMTALAFELLAHALDPLNKTFDSPDWLGFFLVWYGLLYTVPFLALRSRPLWLIVLVGAILGLLAEIFIFHRVNYVVDPIVYAIMFVVPFGVYKLVTRDD